MPKKIPKGTVKMVNDRGEAQLSPDLVITRKLFLGFANPKKKRILLFKNWNQGLRIWYPAPRSRSARICLGKLLKEIGIEPESIVGNIYKGEIYGEAVYIFFDRKKN